MPNNTDILIKNFGSLPANQFEQHQFSVTKVLQTQHFLGKTDEGFPVFFVRTNASKQETADVRLKIMHVEFMCPCLITDDLGNNYDDVYSVITLDSADSDLCKLFISIFSNALTDMDPLPSCRQLSIEIENIKAIFSQINTIPSHSIQGLWAELLVIEQSKNPDTLISAWHQSPTDKYDFTLGPDKIEVKSTSTEGRTHHFSSEQLTPSIHSHLVVVSLQVRTSGEGEGAYSIKGLCDKIFEKVTSVSRKKVYTIVVQTLGSSISEYDKKFFDYVSAKDSILYFYLNDIDRIKKEDIPPSIHQVEFDADLGSTPPIGSPESTFNLQNRPLYKDLL